MELVVVILVLGTLAGVAAPKLLNCTSVATEQCHRQSLSVVRDAIDFYTASTGALPGQSKKSDDFQLELAPYLRGRFPESPFATNKNKAAEVRIRSKGDPLADHVSGPDGWLYDNLTGEFITNSDELSSDGITLYSEF